VTLAVLLALLAPAATARELHFDPVGHPLNLVVDKLGLMAGKQHHFQFPSYRGTIRFDPAAPAQTHVDLEIDAGDFRLLDTWVSEKDRKKIADYTRSAKMLDTAKYPVMSFHSESVEAAGDGYKVTGELTIRGMTKPVVLSVKARPEGDSLVVEGESSFSMAKFGLKPPSALLGAIRTKDEMTLRFTVVAK
jgi:polyisoprenoid-binding protein YceI